MEYDILRCFLRVELGVGKEAMTRTDADGFELYSEEHSG